MTEFQLTTPRLLLIACTEAIYSAMLESNAALSNLLQIEVPDNWSDFGLEPYVWAYEQLQADREQENWLTYIIVHQADQKMIGTCGYKGKPDAEGVVEIGYGIISDYRLQGLATEAAKALIDHAFAQDSVQKVMAHTLAEENASVYILRKCGMQFIQAIEDPEDGTIWQWCVYQ